MKQFYYEQNGQQIGPITVEELRPLQINGETLIWHDGLIEWTKAKEIFELSDYFNKQPPPLPQRRQIKIDSIYDLTYKKETDAITAGVALLLTPLFLKLMGVFTFDNEQSYHTTITILTLGALIVRIIIALSVIDIARRQNRNTTGWGLCAFFLPSISLITIGCLNRLKIEGQPTFAELNKAKLIDNRTKEQKEIDNKKIRHQNRLLLIAIVFMMGGLIVLLTIFHFWK